MFLLGIQLVLSVFIHNGNLWITEAKALETTMTLKDWGEADFYKIYATSVAGDVSSLGYGGGRPGSATTSHSCAHVRSVPADLRSASHMYPSGLSAFYQKYTEAYGLPIVGSSRLSDDSMRRACYTVRFLFADRADFRNSYYKQYGRFALIAATEYTTQIPEFSDLPPYWNERARGFGATKERPVSLGAEENAMCWRNQDKWHAQDIVMHEFAHGLHLLGANYAIPGFHSRLQSLYNSARSRGLWYNTYSLSTETEYLAEGVQSYFGVQRYANPPDGINNHVDTREKLRGYDPALYELIKGLFPCNNDYIKRCQQDRSAELSQTLRMDCPPDGMVPGGTTQTPTAACNDHHVNCDYWAKTGECSRYQAYMYANCPRSCGVCTSGPNCSDDNPSCAYWASTGECSKNPAYMLTSCKRSCNAC